MPANETIPAFLSRQGQTGPGPTPFPAARPAGQFNVYDVARLCTKDLDYNRRDFYKISLLTGQLRLTYATREIVVDRPALLFSNPLVPYACETTAPPSGYFCVFTEDFLSSTERGASLQDSPLFKIGGDPVFFLAEAQLATARYLFQQLLAEHDSEYLHKHELLRNYVNLLLHEALKMQPHTGYQRHPNAGSRLVALFLELLERQFPLDSPARPLRLRTASDYAACLSVHVNYLNRTVRTLTGKPTTAHIAERILGEAKVLLRHTTWPVADIAHGLGFAYPTYFNNFFKQHTGLTPTALRA